MDLIKIATLSEFENKTIKSYSIFGKRVAIIKRKDGTFYAIESGCKHQGADLTAGNVVGNIATCPRHGWRYDLESGMCLNRNSSRLRRHELLIEGEEIRISLRPVDY